MTTSHQKRGVEPTPKISRTSNIPQAIDYVQHNCGVMTQPLSQTPRKLLHVFMGIGDPA